MSCLMFSTSWCLLDCLEIERMRKLIESIINEHSLEVKCNRYNDERLITNCHNFGENTAKSKVKYDKRLIDIDTVIIESEIK